MESVHLNDAGWHEEILDVETIDSIERGVKMWMLEKQTKQFSCFHMFCDCHMGSRPGAGKALKGFTGDIGDGVHTSELDQRAPWTPNFYMPEPAAAMFFFKFYQSYMIIDANHFLKIDACTCKTNLTAWLDGLTRLMAFKSRWHAVTAYNKFLG